ncbi:hypothetical protein D3C80_1150700 [compost metagenome]
MFKAIFSIILFFLCWTTVSVAQTTPIEVDTVYGDYTVSTASNSQHRILSFRKDKDSIAYTGLHYSFGLSVKSTRNLSAEMLTMKQLWDKALPIIKTDLKSVSIGYPYEYIDVLKNYIAAFNQSPEWNNYVKKNGKKLNNKLVNHIMLTGNVYKPLDSLLHRYGYKITGFSTEKHGFIAPKDLISNGFKGTEIIQVPFMVWINVERIKTP